MASSEGRLSIARVLLPSQRDLWQIKICWFCTRMASTEIKSTITWVTGPHKALDKAPWVRFSQSVWKMFFSSFVEIGGPKKSTWCMSTRCTPLATPLSERRLHLREDMVQAEGWGSGESWMMELSESVRCGILHLWGGLCLTDKLSVYLSTTQLKLEYQ